jgi:SAM-dependent methyltransferase
MKDSEMLEVNRRRWDEKVEANQCSSLYDLEGFLNGGSSLMPVELDEMGDVKGKSMLHLQCHFGMDSLSWARKGAEVTGVDFSPKAIEKARWLSEKIGVKARFIESNLYSMEKVLDERFDILYTSYGVICWLPDLKEWGRLIAKYLKPGGFFYIVESHPFGNTVDEKSMESFQASYSYFSGPPVMFDDDHPMDEGHEFQNKERYEWFHPLADIINSLTSQGLHIDFLHEFPQCFFPMHPGMVRRDDGYWYFEKNGFDVPMLFSLKASKSVQQRRK